MGLKSSAYKFLLTSVLIFNSSVVYCEDQQEFPWQMNMYKYAHLSANQKKIYLYSYFETIGFVLYSYTADRNDKNYLSEWIDCVLKTKDSNTWTPEFGWSLGHDLKKSAAYVLYNKVSPVVCKKRSAELKSGAQVLILYNYSDWEKFSIKDKAVYLAGYLDTIASIEMRRKAAGGENDLRTLRIIIEAAGIDGILSDVLEVEFERKYPLPWSISRGLGITKMKIFPKGD